MLKIFFPEMFTQAHRTHERRLQLEYAFNKLGANPVANYTDDCDCIFVGDIHVGLKPHIRDVVDNSKKPIIRYVADLYSMNVHGPHGAWWWDYIYQLKDKCNLVLTAGESTSKRVKEYAKVDSEVALFPVNHWEQPKHCPPQFIDKVVDVMRPYPDPNAGIVRKACDELGIPCIESQTSLPWDDFKCAVSYARLLVSCYFEASTGGLTLIEGYWHGVPSLVGNSPYNGAIEYMGDRAEHFRWDNFQQLKSKINDMYHNLPPRPSYLECAERRHWVLTKYSEERFASDIITAFKRFL